MATTFYLGSHRPRWLETSPVPLFISYNTLSEIRSRGDRFPKGLCRWALDSGVFGRLAKGQPLDGPDTYGGAVYRMIEDIGTPPDFCAPQDMMCERHIRTMTGLSTLVHQELTVDSVLYLRDEFPHAPWIPVLQGQSLEEYLAHCEMYAQAGIDLTAEPLVGLGSVCRRQSTREIGAIVGVLHAMGLRLHGFGVKREGLARYGHCLASADSLAWSQTARWDQIKLPGCTHEGFCNNCQRFALEWREWTVEALESPQQQGLLLQYA